MSYKAKGHVLRDKNAGVVLSFDDDQTEYVAVYGDKSVTIRGNGRVLFFDKFEDFLSAIDISKADTILKTAS